MVALTDNLIDTGDISPDSLKDGATKVNLNFTELESPAGASYIGCNPIGNLTQDDVQGIIQELETNKAEVQLVNTHIINDSIHVTATQSQYLEALGGPIQGQLNGIFSGLEFIGEPMGSISFNYSAASVPQQLPPHTGTLRIYTDTLCHIAFGTTSGISATINSMPFAGGVEVIGIPLNITYIDIFPAETDGMANITGINVDSVLDVGSTTTLNYTNTAQFMPIPTYTTSKYLRVYNTTNCYIRFGALASSSDSIFIGAGFSTIAKPSGAQVLSVIRDVTNGKIYLTGLS